MATFQTLNKKNLYNSLLYKKFFSKFETWPFTSIRLEMSINWHTKSQGPKKNVPILKEGGFTPGPLTLLVIRVVLLHMLYGVLNPLIPQLYIHMYVYLKWSCNTFRTCLAFYMCDKLIVQV